jgi:hypothetical protein
MRVCQRSATFQKFMSGFSGSGVENPKPGTEGTITSKNGWLPGSRPVRPSPRRCITARSALTTSWNQSCTPSNAPHQAAQTRLTSHRHNG